MAREGDLEIAVDELPGERALLRVRGELDLASVGELERALADVASWRPLVIDLTDCPFLDSSALRALLARAGEEGSDVSIVAPDGGIRKTLEIAGLDTMLRIHPSLAEAI